MKANPLATCASIVLLTPLLATQITLAELSKDTTPTNPTPSYGVAVGDLDGDGMVDLVFANYGAPTQKKNEAWRNLGNGKFEDMSTNWLPGLEENSTDIAVIDIDGDGDRDLIVANYFAPSRLLLNDGTGVMTDATERLAPAAVRSNSIAVFDADGDSDLDIVLAFEDRSGSDDTVLYANDGNAFFTAVPGAFSPARDRTSQMAAGDIDGDGDIDLVAATDNTGNKVYLNDGTGRFTATAAGFGFARSTCVALADIDGDLDLDVVFGNAYVRGDALSQNQLYRNDGNNTFTEVTPTQLPAATDTTYSVAFGDVDGDFDVDLLIGNLGSYDQVYDNDGSGTFTDASATRMIRSELITGELEFADLDGDGDLDAAGAQGLGSAVRNVVYYNEGGALVDTTNNFAPVGISGPVVDVTGDGFIESVAVTATATTVRLNDRGWHFSNVVESDGVAFSPPDQAFADVDGDGDQDIIVASSSLSPTELLLNDGAGRFTNVTATNMPPDKWNVSGIAAGDIDGDGDIDAVLSIAGAAFGQGAINRVILNDGNGVFTVGTPFGKVDDARGVDLADIDGDGDLDAAIAGWKTPIPGGVRLYANDGNGVFTELAYLPPDFNTLQVLFDDVDNDGDPDLWSTGPRLYRNNGTGQFTQTAHGGPAIAFPSTCVPADLDGDGDHDLLIWSPGKPAYVWENDGSGTYTDVSATAGLGTAKTRRIDVGDIEGDGDVDVLVRLDDAPYARIYQNLTQQLDVPNIAKLGQGYRVNVHARNGLAAILFLSVQLLPTPVMTPFGLQQIDLGTAFATPILVMGSSTLPIDFALPPLPQFAGIDLYGQAAVLRGGIGVRFTNVVGDRLLR